MQDKPPESNAALGALLDKQAPRPELTPLNATVAELEARLEEIGDKLLEEGFVWIIVAMILFDAYIFSHMDNWAGPLVIGILELIGVVIMADRCEVNTVAPLIDRLTGFLNKAAQKGLEGED